MQGGAAATGAVMNGEFESSDTAVDTADERRVLRAHRHRQSGQEQVRALGPKAAVRYARRQRLSLAKAIPKAARTPVAGEFILATEDGALAFSLRALRSGLYVERTQRRPLGALLVQSMIFDGNEAFLRWCAADPVRFDHPLLSGRLRRQGDELLRAKP